MTQDFLTSYGLGGHGLSVTGGQASSAGHRAGTANPARIPVGRVSAESGQGHRRGTRWASASEPPGWSGPTGPETTSRGAHCPHLQGGTWGGTTTPTRRNRRRPAEPISCILRAYCTSRTLRENSPNYCYGHAKHADHSYDCEKPRVARITRLLDIDHDDVVDHRVGTACGPHRYGTRDGGSGRPRPPVGSRGGRRRCRR